MSHTQQSNPRTANHLWGTCNCGAPLDKYGCCQYAVDAAERLKEKARAKLELKK